MFSRKWNYTKRMGMAFCCNTFQLQWGCPPSLCLSRNVLRSEKNRQTFSLCCEALSWRRRVWGWRQTLKCCLCSPFTCLAPQTCPHGKKKGWVGAMLKPLLNVQQTRKKWSNHFVTQNMDWKHGLENHNYGGWKQPTVPPRPPHSPLQDFGVLVFTAHFNYNA